MPEPVQPRALIERSVWDDGAFFPRIEYLQCEEPLTWTRERAAAQVFADYMEADALARRLSTREMHVFPVVPDTASTIAATVPARERRRNQLTEIPETHHDWREDVPNAGVL